MAQKYDYVVGVDPGVTGGISIINKKGSVNVNRMPVREVIVNKKEKKIYDLETIREILKNNCSKKVLFVQELVSAMPGNGNVSMFGFGRSSGLTIGLAMGLDFDVVEVSSMKWKKHFPQLITKEILAKKQEIKDLRVKAKTIKDKQAQKSNKKDIDKLNRQVKTLSKAEARNLVSSLYPKIKDEFKQVNSDGMAESILIALYGQNEFK